ncbi:MAG TPA: ATP-binding protein [Kineosporiaceae bacterium]
MEQRGGRVELIGGDLFAVPGQVPADPHQEARRRRQLDHDLQHGLATIALLAEAVQGGAGLEREAAERLRHLQSEVRRLALLLAEEFQDDPAADVDGPVRVDLVVREVCKVLAATSAVPVDAVTEPVHCAVGPGSLWRVLSNLTDNAIRAVAGRGRVQIRVRARDSLAIVEVDDSGPGFGLGGAGLASLGLGIVQDFVARYDGTLEIGAGSLGGCRVRISLAAVPVLGLVDSAASSAAADTPATR